MSIPLTARQRDLKIPSAYGIHDRGGTSLLVPVLLALLICGLCLGEECHGFTLQSRYATINYNDRADLIRFNDELYLGGQLRARVRRKSPETVEEEVAAKIDVIVEKTMKVLDMYPLPLKFSVDILPDTEAVAAAFKRIYNVDVNYIAFYSPRLNHVFYSSGNGRLRVTCHEIGHVVVENYFKVSPPQRIHEVMAQFVEKHIND